MAFRNEPGTNDNGSFRSISDCTSDMEERAVVSVFRNNAPEDRGQVLDLLGLTGVAEGMLAARDARAAGASSPVAPTGTPA